MTEKYKRYTVVGGKPRWIIVDDYGGVINRYPGKDELKGLQTETYKMNVNNRSRKYEDNELLDYLKTFYQRNGRIPISRDFDNNPGYPGYDTYQKRFGSWNNALKLSGLDNREKYSKTKRYTDGELLDYLKTFYQENGRIPLVKDFANNPGFPSPETYRVRFGTWNKALKMVELDVDIMVKLGMLDNRYHKGRLFEILVKDHFENKPIDLSGDNRNNPCDGICPNGKTYDVKSSKLHIEKYWNFHTANKYKDEIEYYYFGAFNKFYTELMYVWRVPGEIVEGNSFIVGLDKSYKFNVENMMEYEITDRFDIL